MARKHYNWRQTKHLTDFMEENNWDHSYVRDRKAKQANQRRKVRGK